MKRPYLPLALFAAAFAQACSAAAPIGAGGGGSSASSSSSDAASSSAVSSTASSSSSASTSASSSSSSSSSGGGNPACGPGSDLIYMVSSIRSIFTFDPKTLAFNKIGSVNCNIDPNWYPTTMSVDRQGTLHIRFVDGHIYDVDSKTLACKETPYVQQQGDFFQFEMSYTADAPGAATDTLYLSGWKGWGLETLDTTNWTTKPVAPYDLVKEYAVLAGTPDARLFAMFISIGNTPPILAELDKTNAHVLSQTPIPGLPTISVYQGSVAFAFWGGELYIFYTDMVTFGVEKYTIATQTFSPVNAPLPTNFGLTAASSTCVQLVP